MALFFIQAKALVAYNFKFEHYKVIHLSNIYYVTCSVLKIFIWPLPDALILEA